MDEHEKCHYQSFFQCQVLFYHFKSLTMYCERCYMCETCNKPFDRLQIIFERLLEDVKITLSNGREIPYKVEHFDRQKNEYRKIRSIKEAKGVLKKGQQVLERSLKMAKTSAALTTKFDALLMRAFYRNESRVLLYPKICDTIIPYQVEIVNAFAKYFGIYFIERVKSMTYTLENPAFIREKDIDEFLLKKKHIGFRRIANGKVKEDFKNLPFFGEIEKHLILEFS